MFLASSPSLLHFNNPFTIQQSSPLAPRDANALPRPPSLFTFLPTTNTTNKMTMPSSSSSYLRENNPSPLSLETTASKSKRPQRSSKYSTLYKNKDEERVRRRGEYLSKVKEASEERKHEARGEQALRLSFFERQKAWEEEQKRIMAEQYLMASPEDEEEGEQHTAEGDDHLVEEFAAIEEQEMEDILALSSSSTAAQAGGGGGGAAAAEAGNDCDMTDYGSDEEEYDRILMEIAMHAEQNGVVANYQERRGEEEPRASSGADNNLQEDDFSFSNAMDMSNV